LLDRVGVRGEVGTLSIQVNTKVDWNRSS